MKYEDMATEELQRELSIRELKRQNRRRIIKQIQLVIYLIIIIFIIVIMIKANTVPTIQ